MMYESELYHHGVRRTPVQLGHKPYSEHQKKSMTKKAVGIMKTVGKTSRSLSQIETKKADSLHKKADKNVWTSEKHERAGNQEKFNKYQGKAWNQLYRKNQHRQKAEDYVATSTISDIAIKAIKEGRLKAGKDFVAGNDVQFGVLNVKNTKYVDFYKDKKKVDSYAKSNKLQMIPVYNIR